MANLGKSPERSNFAQTCNLLSQYLKGKGTLGEINAKLDVKGHETKRPPATATTLDLLPILGNSDESSKKKDMASANTVNTTDFFAQHVASSRVDLTRSDDVNPENGQMTIFYAGKVIVLNDFPAEKAKEIMEFARKASNNGFNSFVSTPPIEPQHVPLYMIPQDSASDLPIARKNSLHRFLKKRNDRVIVRSTPYERENHGLPPKPNQEKKWLDL